jgi:hypothetical protein
MSFFKIEEKRLNNIEKNRLENKLLMVEYMKMVLNHMKKQAQNSLLEK